MVMGDQMQNPPAAKVILEWLSSAVLSAYRHAWVRMILLLLLSS